jgi:hypothetical protein
MGLLQASAQQYLNLGAYSVIVGVVRISDVLPHLRRRAAGLRLRSLQIVGRVDPMEVEDKHQHSTARFAGVEVEDKRQHSTARFAGVEAEGRTCWREGNLGKVGQEVGMIGALQDVR